MVSVVSSGGVEAVSGAGRSAFQQATVCDGAVATSYRVAGTGRPIVFLGEADGPLPQALLHGLASRARLIVPDVDAAVFSGRAFSAWLRGFLDGLGLGEVAAVASGRHALAVLGFMLVEARVTRLVLLSHDTEDPAAPACAIHDELSCAAGPLLLVRSDAGAPAGLATEVMNFLSGAAG